MNALHKSIVTNFIEDIWNKNQFDLIDDYIHPEFIDNSLPASLPSNKEGMKQWILTTGKSFQHKTLIEDLVCENNKVMLKIKIQMKHIGVWRGIEPTYKEISTGGYRLYKISDQKIIEHWALIDGNAIENQLISVQHGCEIKK
ncbi:MAG TPA: ester cyclase [Ohtaekwangia sp.]|nr:ester cyclase [Ohtaekwangia sp.]